MGKITAGLFISLDGVVDAPINCTFRTSTTRWVPQSTQPSVAPTPSSLTQDLLELRGGVAGARDGRGRGLPIRQAAGRARKIVASKRKLEFSWRCWRAWARRNSAPRGAHPAGSGAQA
jgi:hypothetical protein